MLTPTKQEAIDFIKEWPHKDDFIQQHYRLTSTDGDDNTLGLSYYWETMNDIASESIKPQE